MTGDADATWLLTHDQCPATPRRTRDVALRLVHGRTRAVLSPVPGVRPRGGGTSLQAAWKHERRLLLAAPSRMDRDAPILPPGPTPAAQGATRRAVASLRQHGLIVLSRVSADDPTPHTVRTTDPALCAALDRQYVRVRFMRRTSRGDEIVKRYRQELESGGRIRWATSLDDARDACLAACPNRHGSP